MATIDNLSIQVTTSADSAASALDRLASSAGGLRGAATRAGGGMRDLSAGAKDAGTATQRAGQQAGNAEKHTRNYGRAAEEAGKAAKRGTAGISSFWQALKRVAYYRFIRTIIKEITSAFKEGFGAVYQWSKSVGGSFAANIDSIKSSVNLLKGSLGALAVPLINSLTPAINGVINVLITMINAFNIAIAAINGQDTYTMAVRGANAVANSVGNVANGLSDVASNAEDASKAMRSILGFDEINKLQAVKDGGSGGGSTGGGGGGGGGGGIDGISFVEKPLEGIWKKISDITDGMPDWLKWLLTGTALVGGFKLISWLIDKIKDFLGGLVNFNIPDWLKWLFGPKGEGDTDLPDGKIKVDIEKGDWSALDELNDVDVDVNPKLTTNGETLWNQLKNEWDAVGNKKLFFDIATNQNANGLWKGLETSWAALGNKKLYFDVGMNQNANGLWKGLETSWEALGNKKLFFDVGMNQNANGLWKGLEAAWEALGLKKLFFDIATNQNANGLWEGLKTAWEALGLKKLYFDVGMNQNANGLWEGLKTAWDALGDKTLKVKVELDYSGTDGFGGATGGGGSTSGGGGGRTVKVPVEPVKSDNWEAEWDKLVGGEIPAKVTATVGYGEGTDKNSVLNLFTWGQKVIGTGAKRDDEVGKTAPLDLFTWGQKVVGTGAKRDDEVGKTAPLDLFTWGQKVVGTGAKRDDEVSKTAPLDVFTWGQNVFGTGAKLGDGVKKDAPLSKFSWSKKVSASGANRGTLKQTAVLDLFTWAKSITITAISFASGVLDGIKKKIKEAIDSATKGAGAATGGVIQNGRLTRFESGGIINNGFVRKLPHYAGGTTDAHGTLFVAGEAGPEILGHIGGRTEILNQSQLAATMFAAVRSAMGGVKIAATFYNGDASESSEADYEMMYRAMYDAFTDAMAPNAERDREKVALMRQIAAKEFTAEVTANSMNRAQTRMNRRAGTTITPVGT